MGIQYRASNLCEKLFCVVLKLIPSALELFERSGRLVDSVNFLDGLLADLEMGCVDPCVHLVHCRQVLWRDLGMRGLVVKGPLSV